MTKITQPASEEVRIQTSHLRPGQGLWMEPQKLNVNRGQHSQPCPMALLETAAWQRPQGASVDFYFRALSPTDKCETLTAENFHHVQGHSIEQANFLSKPHLSDCGSKTREVKMTKVASLSPRVILELNHQFIHNTHSSFSLIWFLFYDRGNLCQKTKSRKSDHWQYIIFLFLVYLKKKF